MELYKSRNEEGYLEVPDVTTKKVVTTYQHLKGLGEPTIQGTPKQINLFEPTVTPEAATSFSTPSKGKKTFLKRAIEKTKAARSKVCRLCGKSSNIPLVRL